MNRRALAWTRFLAVILLGVIGLATTGASWAAPRATAHRVGAKSRSRPRASLWPHITTLKPDRASVNVGPYFGDEAKLPHNPPLVPIVVLGTNFRRGASVRWNGKALATQFVSPGRLEAAIPDAELEETAFTETLRAAITVVNPGIKGHTSRPVAFQVDREAMGG